MQIILLQDQEEVETPQEDHLLEADEAVLVLPNNPVLENQEEVWTPQEDHLLDEVVDEEAVLVFPSNPVLKNMLLEGVRCLTPKVNCYS